MVGWQGVGRVTFLLLAATTFSATAQSPAEQMFPTSTSCYAREYTAAHLAQHPVQRVTSMALTPAQGTPPDPRLQLWVTMTLKDEPGEQLLALGFCENSGADALSCLLEGDAGGFTLTPAKGGSVLLRVAGLGMGFEGAHGFVTLERNRGDDRSFLLPSTRDCR
jgi:hypothetical protein